MDTRLIAATNRDLKGMVEKGEFREDLFYRLYGRCQTSAVRERQNDILLLNHYLALFNEENKKQINGFELKDAGTPKHQCVQLFNDLVHLLRLRTEFRQGTGRPFRMRNTALSNLIHLRNSYIDLLQPFRLLIA